MNQSAQELRDLAFFLSNGNDAVSDAVYLSATNPEAYIKTYAGELENRGIYAPVEGLSWIALVDGLEKNGKLVELDWKERGEMFVEAVLKLTADEEKAEQIHEALESIFTDASAKVSDILESINEELEPFDYNVIMIDINADCYPITVIRLTARTLVLEAADRIELDRIYSF